ncbi:hypothetical protein LTR78_007932 [Recurvomyces mirabilis]|uniref:Uncharacterized protein n=1 Tax=Recurvomyces mirabilis TaxID=574656 RepID=A0AAE0WFX2_9PEZI|nr:hypothetical protein LTR78_007932 [Recurvomyces mirabilis]KAK5152467.1 hypothetical protein LTS14_008414 [Recurvomyces mirabilis]
MTVSSFATRVSTLRRLHQAANRNLSRSTRRYESSHTTSSTRNTSTPPGRTIPGPSWAWVEPLATPFRAYGAMQRRSPLMTQFSSSLIIYFLGDLSAQSVGSNGFSEEGSRYEPIRGLRAMIIASICCIPSYKWFLWLGNNFNYSSHWFSIGVKILVNQTFFTPVFNTYFFGMQSLLAGASWSETIRRVKETVPISFVNSWKLWPAVTAFSFTYLKPRNRPIFAGCIAVVWQTYLSWLNKQAEGTEEQEVVGSGAVVQDAKG